MQDSWEAVVKFNEEHDVTGKAKKAAEDSWQAVNKFNQEHDVTGKVAGGITWAANGISDWLQPRKNS